MCLRCKANNHDACEAKHGAISPCSCSCVNPLGLSFVELCQKGKQ